MPNVFGRKTGLIGATGTVLLLLAFASPAIASGPAWLSPVKLSVDGSDAQTPVIAMDGNGDSDAAWALASGTLQTSYRGAGPGDSFVEQDVGGSSGSTAPDVSEDGGGDAEAVWLESGSVNWSYRTNDVDGFGGASGINNDTCAGSESDPRVAVDSNANVIGVYLCNGSGTETVEAVYAAGGTAGSFNTAPSNPNNGPPVPLSDGLQNASNIQIAEDPNGDAIVVWQESNGTNQQIYYAYRPNGNTSTWTTAQLVGSAPADQTTPTVSMDGSGNAAVAYVIGGNIQEQDANNTTIAGAGSFSAANALTTDGTASKPQIADDSNGDTAVIWVDAGNALVNVRPSGGSFAATATTLSPSAVDAGSQPQIAITSNDDPIALWQSGDTIYASVDTGAGFPNASQISTGSNPATEPALAVDGNGDAVASWIQSDGTNQIATAAGYDSGAGPSNNNLHIPANGVAGSGLTVYTQPYDVWPAITSIVWKVDGAQVGTGDNITWVPQSGSHTVSVTSTNADGNQTTSSQSIDIAASQPTVPGGGLTQLPSPGDCVTSAAVGCGTLFPYGLSNSFQLAVSPDGKDVYAVGQGGGTDSGGLVEFSRNGATGALAEIGCITGAASVSGCATSSLAAMDNPSSVAVSPDGADVYVVTQGENAIVTFSRNASTGLLTELAGSCYSSNVVAGCTPDPGLSYPWGVTVTSDGKNVYATSNNGHDIAEFARNTSTGALSLIPGNTCISDGTNASCQLETGGGLANLVGITAYGSNVYGIAGGTQPNGDVSEFTRNASTGALTPISGNACIGGASAPAACLKTATDVDGTEDMAITPDGQHAYSNSFFDDAIVEFQRNTGSGALSQIGCVGTSASPAGLCSTHNAAGIDGPLGVAVTPDGTDLYASGAFDNAEAAFAIDPATGQLTQLPAPFNCITQNSSGCGANDATGLSSARRVTVSPDGKNVYAANQGGDGIAELARTPVLRTLTVTVSGSGTGSVSDGASLNCTTASSPCNEQYAPGTQVTLSETPSGGSTFAGWSGGGCSGTGATCQVTMSGAENVTATFNAPQKQTKGQISNGSEASWDTGATAGSASATVTVPAVSCSGITSGTFAGQSAGVELYGSETVSGKTVYPAEDADVRTYCSGTTPVYETSFVVNDVTNDTLVFDPAGVTVSPGDPLDLALTAASSGATLKITDVNTGKSASITGPGFIASGGADIGVTGIDGNGHGAPMLTGSEPAANPFPTIPGPVQSSPVLFQNVTVDAQPIASPASLYGVRWVSADKRTVATPTAIAGTNEFAVDFTSVSPPALAKTADVAPVSGTVLIELPGTHKFVPLKSIKQVPNGTIIDATHGSVQITVALPGGGTQTGVFFDGEFKLEQSASGQTTAVLEGGTFAGCPKPPAAKKPKHKKGKHGAPDAGIASAQKHRPKGSHVRNLWSNAHGNFGTQGKYGAGAVRGTEWLTQDQCDGTYFKVTRDAITVTSFKLHNRKTVVTQGHHFLAPAPGYK